MTRLLPLLAVSLALSGAAQAQTPRQIRDALNELRSDKREGNCGKAVAWLYPKREKLRDVLVEELYRTDPQATRAIMFILFNTASFTPDQRFVRLVATTLTLDNPIHDAGWFDLPFPRDDALPAGVIVDRWEYVNARYTLFEPLLIAQLGTTKDPWMLWAPAWLFNMRGTLKEKASLFTPQVLATAASHLRDDPLRFNASQAVRLFLLLGEQSVPTLEAAAQSKDRQTRSIAQATLDALKGKRRAWGYLSVVVDLTHELFRVGEPKDEPEWLPEAIEPFRDQDDPQYP